MQYTKTEMEGILKARVWDYKDSVNELKRKLKEEERYLKIARKQVRDFEAGRI